MRRVVALFLPTFPTDQIWRRNGGTPVRKLPMVMAIPEGNRRVLASVDDAARKLKFACGMTVAHAQTLVPDLLVEDAKPEEDQAVLVRLAHWCTRYSPLVTPYPPDTIFIDVAGSSHLFKGEAALLKDLHARLSSAELSARAAIADTPGCAWAVSPITSTSITAIQIALHSTMKIRRMRLISSD
jgi:protein ImuB